VRDRALEERVRGELNVTSACRSCCRSANRCGSAEECRRPS
jgi:hypothetical protein